MSREFIDRLAGLQAVTTAVGLEFGMASSLFAVALCFTLVTMYDAAGVRYHSGEPLHSFLQLPAPPLGGGNRPMQEDLVQSSAAGAWSAAAGLIRPSLSRPLVC